jgi:hypothetical protein
VEGDQEAAARGGRRAQEVPAFERRSGHRGPPAEALAASAAARWIAPRMRT